MDDKRSETIHLFALFFRDQVHLSDTFPERGALQDGFETSQTAAPKTTEVIEAHLRADRNLDDATAEAIANMVKAAYALGQRKKNADE